MTDFTGKIQNKKITGNLQTRPPEATTRRRDSFLKNCCTIIATPRGMILEMTRSSKTQIFRKFQKSDVKNTEIWSSYLLYFTK